MEQSHSWEAVYTSALPHTFYMPAHVILLDLITRNASTTHKISDATEECMWDINIEARELTGEISLLEANSLH
jgi:cytochrome bd-type quinol oxidase subunit 2